jgi:hypothetical protein
MSGVISFLMAVKKFKRAMGVIWAIGRVIHVDFLPFDVTSNAQYYNTLLCNNVHQTVWKKITWKTVKEDNSVTLRCLSTY